MRKTVENFNFKKLAEYNVDKIRKYVENFSDEWLIDTARQDNSKIHKQTFTYYINRANLYWKDGEEFIVETKSQDQTLLDLVEPIVKDLERIHDGVRGMVLLIKLKANEDIPIHHDSGDYLMFSRRNHIPIITSDGVLFGVGDEEVNMKAGECWEVNNSRHHLVKNNSNIDRVHLLIDIMPNVEIKK
jgi:hypothetical protein